MGKHLLTVPTKCTIFILYMYLLYSPTYFGAVCTIFRKNYHASYWKPHIAKIILNVVSVVFYSSCFVNILQKVQHALNILVDFNHRW